ncbi:hypothetical protein [Mesorhizobium sp. Cs1299R1N3]|uniref:hypothetical protein n=1 Tax=Mesorhizobium sp. Cs1299R1N3 TaxID=3015173 RepID=UPI00301C9173
MTTIEPDHYADADLATKIILSELERDIAAMLDVEFHRRPKRKRPGNRRPEKQAA